MFNLPDIAAKLQSMFGFVSSNTNPVTGRIKLQAPGTPDVMASYGIETAPRYPAYYAKRPLQSTVLPFGTAAINESVATGTTVTRSIDTATTFNGQVSSKFTAGSGATTPNFEVGVNSAAITLDAEGQALLSRKPLVAVKIGAGNTLSSATLYVGDGTYTNFYTFGLTAVATIGGWTILSRTTTGATSTTGTPNLAAAVRSKLRLIMTSNVAAGDVWVAPLYVLPQPKPSVVFTCDDGYSEWTWLAAEAAKRGIPISFGIVKSLIGTNGYLTESQMLSIANDYDGLFELTTHADEHVNYPTMGLAPYVADIQSGRDYLVGLGCSAKAASLHQYVQGQFDQTLIDAMKSAGFLSCREVGASNRASGNLETAIEGATCNSLYKLPATCQLDGSIGAPGQLATAKTYITTAASLGSAFIMGHRFGAAAGAIQWVKGYDATYGVLDLLDWLAEQRDSNGWQLRKWSDWYDDQIHPKLPAVL